MSFWHANPQRLVQFHPDGLMACYVFFGGPLFPSPLELQLVDPHQVVSERTECCQLGWCVHLEWLALLSIGWLEHTLCAALPKSSPCLPVCSHFVVGPLVVPAMMMQNIQFVSSVWKLVLSRLFWNPIMYPISFYIGTMLLILRWANTLSPSSSLGHCFAMIGSGVEQDWLWKVCCLY